MWAILVTQKLLHMTNSGKKLKEKSPFPIGHGVELNYYKGKIYASMVVKMMVRCILHTSVNSNKLHTFTIVDMKDNLKKQFTIENALVP